MYKIYINETPLILTTNKDAMSYGPASEKILILRYPGKKKFLINIINQLENSSRFERIVVFNPDLKELMDTFSRCFKVIDAAGGVVFNEQLKLLVMYRRGFWDLPKGKIDKGETIEQAAIREVSEETGINNITLGTLISTTYHTYSLKGNRILKRTFWYKMHTSDTDITPQVEEDIEKVAWVDLDTFMTEQKQIYGNILDILTKVKTQ